MIIRSSAVLGFLLVVGACTPNAPDPSGDAPGDTAARPVSQTETGDPVQPIDCDGLERTILRTVAQRAPMRAVFGTPDSVRSTVEPNRHIPGVTDSLFVVHYPGFTVDIRKPHRGDDMPVHVRVSDNRYLRYPQAGIGAPADRVVRSLGAPASRGASRLVYDCGIHVEQPVVFHLNDGGRVTSVEIQYYVD